MRKKPDPLQGRCCGVCKFWKEQTESGDEIRWGRCRRFPPVAAISRDPDTGDEGDAAIWPATHPDEWCGEWAPGNS